MESTHTPEPWEVHEVHDNHYGDNELISRGFRSSVTGKGINTGENYEMFSAEDAERIVQCVNACAGIADPEATITALKTALKHCEQALVSLSFDALGMSHDDTREWLLRDELLTQVRAALHLAGEQP